MSNRKSNLSVQYMTRIAILGALSAILFMIEIPVVAFYKLDVSTLPALLGAFSMGPMAGLAILLIKDLFGLLHSGTMYVGELADFIMGFAMLLPAGLVYQRMKSRKGAIVGMILGSIVATIVAVLTNVYIMIPFYGTAYGMPVEAIVGMGAAVVPAVDSVWKFVLLITAPFNVLKWAVISVVTALIYKPLSPILHGRRKTKSTEAN